MGTMSMILGHMGYKRDMMSVRYQAESVLAGNCGYFGTRLMNKRYQGVTFILHFNCSDVTVQKRS